LGKLNVGGSCFETSVSTLSKCEFFKAMFLGKIKKNDKGDIIVRIDRDGILKFLLGSKLEKPSVVQDLIVEAKFYGSSELVIVNY